MATESRFDPAAGVTAWRETLTSGKADMQEVAVYIASLEVENDRARREVIELRRRLASAPEEAAGAAE